MYEIRITSRFKKDLKIAKKRGLDMSLLDEVVTLLAEGKKLPVQNRPHKLKGNYTGFHECHIQPDWLLIWEQKKVLKLVTLIRTGTHADLF